MSSIARICSVEGCEKKDRTRSLCGMHYARLLRHGSEFWEPPLRSTRCSVQDCEKDYYTKGYCRSHYERQLIPNIIRNCSIMGCSGTARVRGWCDKHYQRWIFHDNPEAPIRGKEHHGMSESAIYPVWAAMIGRCTKANDPGYKYYGGRGIRVSDRWLNSFANFYQDMGMRPTDRHTLERKDVNGNYEPGNVVWATPTEQARNKRINVKNKSGYAGVWYSKKCKKWRVSIGLNGKTIHIGMYKTIEEAISARQIAEKDYWI